MQQPEVEIPKPQKKAITKKKIKYNTILKVASIMGGFLLLGTLYYSYSVPDVVERIFVIISNFDPFGNLKGGNALDPSDFVMYK